MPDVCAPSIMVSISKRKDDIMNCRCNRTEKLLEHKHGGKMLMERVLEKRLIRIVSVNKMKLSFMPIHTVSILRRIQEEQCGKRQKLHVPYKSREILR